MKKVFKFILCAMAVFVVLLLIVPAFLPSAAHVERSGRIDKTPAEVFAILSDFRHSPEWDPWASEDPTIETKVTGQGIGSTYEWDGEKAGRGKSTMAIVESPSHIKVDIEMYEPMNDQFTAQWHLEEADGGTLATWSYDQELGYVERYIGLAMDSILGASFEQGLSNLKAYAEGQDTKQKSAEQKTAGQEPVENDGEQDDSEQ